MPVTALALLWAACTQADAEHRSLRVRRARLRVEVSDTPRERQVGLQRREALDGGMLLVFPTPQTVSLWNRNTPLALDVVFIDKDGVIRGTAALEPDSSETIESSGPMLYALEVPRGWLDASGARVGDRVHNLPPAAAR